MAGHMLYYYLLNKNKYLLTAVVFHEKINNDSIVCDVRNPSKLSQVIKSVNPEIIVNCIGALVEESNHNPENAILLNSWLPHFLVNECRNINSKLIHISTDCVFNGKKGSYSEIDQTDAVDFYGRTKALGEIINNIDTTIRTSIIGPELKTNGNGLFHWYMNQKGEIDGYPNAIWSGITTFQLSVVIDQIIQYKLSGLFNVTNGYPISKLDLLLLFKKYFNKNILSINSNQKYSVNKSLQKSQKYDFKIPDYESMIIQLKNFMIKNPLLYQQYYK